MKRWSRGILILYFLAITVLYPFYAPGGYMQIGEVKYHFFRNATLTILAAVGIVILLSVLICRDRVRIVAHYRRMSVTDWLLYGYGLVVMVSYLCSDYKEDALWGVEGWYMGVMSQLMFVVLYFLFSRFFCPYCASSGYHGTGRCSEKPHGIFSLQGCLGLWLAAAAGVFLLGICNRYSVYPIVMEGQTETFISTLGNINWFCGYWSVTAPLGIVLYWCSDSGAARMLSGVYSLIAMLSGITQGSSSAYLVFIALFVALLFLSLQSNQKLYRFLELCLLFMLACLAGKWMCHLPGLVYNYWGSQEDFESGITAWLLTGNAMAWLFILLTGLYGLLRVLEKCGRFTVGRCKRHRNLLSAVVVVIVCAAIVWSMMDKGILFFREVQGTGRSLEAVWREDWGNGRGSAWNCAMDAYRSMDTLHRLVGIGPDCFADYIYEIPELGERMYDSFGNLRLTNAHNEWMTVLVNTGVLGLFCYGGFFLTAIARFVKKAGKQPLLYVSAVAALAYTAHNMVSFQQVLNTPYIFIVLGMGEGLRRNLQRQAQESDEDCMEKGNDRVDATAEEIE